MSRFLHTVAILCPSRLQRSAVSSIGVLPTLRLTSCGHKYCCLSIDCNLDVVFFFLHAPLDHVVRGTPLHVKTSPLLFSLPGMPRKVDYSIVGESFGHLIVIELSSHRTPTRKGTTYWDCYCELCGQVKSLPRDNLVSGNTSSCGCRRGLQRKIAKKAGVSETAVSRILNNKLLTPGGSLRTHSLTTIQRVRAVAHELGYYENC